MKINLKSKIQFKIETNPYNKRFLPNGMFLNIPKIRHNNIWYNCYIKFEENTLIITSLISHYDNSCEVKEYIEGVFYQEKTSFLKKNLILYLYNNHPINYKIFLYKTKIKDRKTTILVFFGAFFISAIYWLVNLSYNNSLMDWISKSLGAQSFIIFLTVSGFINIFYPFTIKKEISREDIAKISLDSIEEKKKKDEDNKSHVKENSF